MSSRRVWKGIGPNRVDGGGQFAGAPFRGGLFFVVVDRADKDSRALHLEHHDAWPGSIGTPSL